jgi:hypothetical protein
MSVLTLAFLSLLVQYTQTQTPTEDNTAAGPKVREFRASGTQTCVGHMDTDAVGMSEQRTVLRLLFNSRCGANAQVHVSANPNVLNCTRLAGTTGNPKINEKFDLPSRADLGLTCTLKTGTGRGTYKYRITDCTVSTGTSCSSSVDAAPSSVELEIHVPDK